MRVVYLLSKDNNPDVINMTLEIVRKTEKSVFDIVGVFAAKPLSDAETDMPLNKSELCCYNPFELVRFRSFLVKNKVNIIHVQHITDVIFAKLASWRLPVKTVLTLQDKALDVNGVFKLMVPCLLRRSDALLFILDTQRKNVMSRYGIYQKKNFLVSNCLFPRKVDTVEEKSLRDKLFLPSDCYLIGTVGDFTAERDFLFVCKMVRQLWKKGRDFHCVIAGRRNKDISGLYNECVSYCLKKCILDYVTLINTGDYDGVMKQFDVFVYVVKSDNIGFDMIKAMSLGVPVVVNDTEVTRELSHNGKYAYLYKTDDVNDFAEKTNAVMRNENSRLIAEVVKNEVNVQYNASSYITKMKNVYEDIVN